METFIGFFEDLASWHKLVWIVACLTAALSFESLSPLFKGGFRSAAHTKTNLVFLATLVLINVTVGALTVGLFIWIEETGWGLLNLVEWPIWAELVVAVMAFVLNFQNSAHPLGHRVMVVWRVHSVHHSEMKMGAKTWKPRHPSDFFTEKDLRCQR